MHSPLRTGSCSRWLRVGASLALAAVLLPALPAVAEDPKSVHGISLYGDPLKYQPSFKHFDYVNPNAPKGGTVKTAANGTFDNLNPYNGKGRAAGAITAEALMTTNADELSMHYGWLAEWMEVPADASWVKFLQRSITAAAVAGSAPLVSPASSRATFAAVSPSTSFSGSIDDATRSRSTPRRRAIS